MRSTTASKTVEALEDAFSRWGSCITVVSDNGPQFVSSQFKQLCEKYGIQHVTSAPYHPQSNGRAEKFVDTLKRGLKKLEGEEDTPQKLRILLSSYRGTPSCTLNNRSPFEHMTGRKMRSRLDLLKKSEPYSQGDPHIKSMVSTFNRHHGARARNFSVGDAIFYQLHQNNTWAWKAGTIIKRLGESNYLIAVDNREIKAHANQIQLRIMNTLPHQSDDFDDYCSDFPSHNLDFSQTPTAGENGRAQSGIDTRDHTDLHRHHQITRFRLKQLAEFHRKGSETWFSASLKRF